MTRFGLARKVRTAAAVLRRGGVAYAGVFATRRCVASLVPLAAALGSRSDEAIHRLLDLLDDSLIDVERRRQIAEPWSVTARRFTASDNRTWWNDHDWSTLGEEWTPNQAWKQAILDRFLLPFMPPAGEILEIGPGGGRWTAIIRQLATKLYVLDVASRSLELCRERFPHAHNIEYLLGDGRTIPLEPRSVDGIWSYDVFVHINPVDARGYFSEFARVLRPGGTAVVHHPGSGSSEERARQHRSDLTDRMVVDFAAADRLDVVLQTSELVNDGDKLTVLRKPLQ